MAKRTKNPPTNIDNRVVSGLAPTPTGETLNKSELIKQRSGTNLSADTALEDRGTTAEEVNARQPQQKTTSSQTLAAVSQAGMETAINTKEGSPKEQTAPPPTLAQRFTPAPFQDESRKGQAGGQLGQDIRGAIPEALTEAAVGAGAGLLTGPIAPVAVPALAIAAFSRKLYVELKQDAKQRVLSDKATLRESKKGIQAIINEVNMGGDPEEALELYSRQIQKITAARDRIQRENRGKVIDAEAEDELVMFEEFFDTLKPSFDRKLASAIDNPSGTTTYNLEAGDIEE